MWLLKKDSYKRKMQGNRSILLEGIENCHKLLINIAQAKLIAYL